MIGGALWRIAGVAVIWDLTATWALAFGESAAADLKDRTGNAVGLVELVEASGGVLIRLKLKGLSSGLHALRIYDVGKCVGDFSGAGDIYNPLGAKYGFLNEDGPMAGELPNVHAGSDGVLEAELLTHFVTLGREAEEPLLDADGASILVFEKAGDHTSDPEGNAGARVACGVIAPAK